MRRLAPDATQELTDRSMREMGVPPAQFDRLRPFVEAETLPRSVERQLNRLRRQGIARNDPRFPERLRRLLDARDRLSNFPSNMLSRELRTTRSATLDARTAAWSALIQALFASASSNFCSGDLSLEAAPPPVTTTTLSSCTLASLRSTAELKKKPPS